MKTQNIESKKTLKPNFAKSLVHTSLVAALTIAPAAMTNHAYAAKAKQSNMEQIVVTANRTQEDQFLTLSATEIIGQEEIAVIQPLNVTDLLKTVAGIHVVNQGGAGQQTSVFMRGTNSDHTLVLVDGVRVGSATLGSASFSSMSVAHIERIEIVKGPRAALWGSDALGGVIQIFTKKLTGGESVVGAGFGSHGYWQGSASIGLGSQDNYLTFSASIEESDGFNASNFEEDDDGYDRTAFSLVGASQYSRELSFHLASKYESGGSDYDTKWAGTANEQEYTNYSIKGSAEYKTRQSFTEFALSTSQDEGQNFVSGGDKSDANKIATERDQISLVSQYTLSKNTSVTGGIDYYNEKVSSSQDLVSWVDGVQGWDIEDRAVSAVFAQTRHKDGNWLLEGAVRYDDIENLDSETTYNASLGYQMTKDSLLTYNYGTGFKAPTFNDLYWPGSGNPDLLPETISTHELLYRSKNSYGFVEVSYYQSEIENLIDWAPDASGAWKPSNINEAEIEGVELTYSANVENISQQLTVTYTKTEDKATGKSLLRRPELTASYNLGYQWDALTFNGIVTYSDESHDFTPEPLDSYWLVDLSATYQATQNLRILAKVNNVLDEEYQTAADYYTDGTNYQVSAIYQF